MKLRRKISQYQGGDPAAMSKMSEGAIFYAFDDAKHDILALHEQNAELVKELEKVREVLHEQTTYLAEMHDAYAELHALYDLGDCNATVADRAAIAAAKGEAAK